MTKKKVLFVELNVNRNVLPLVSGYLQAYACTEPEVARCYEFKQFIEGLRTPRDELLSRLLAENAAVYAFSCYVWNMRLVRYLVDRIARMLPNAKVILGGPQVDGHGADYLSAELEHIVVANGEGERIFRDFLLAESAHGELGDVAGLSLYRDGELLHTPRAELIEDINEIPSPYLTGMFEGVYATTVFETNRGCPYACTFCYWGKGDESRLRKFELERLKEELRWIAQRSICYIHIADANWGILARDVELSREIVRCKETLGAPMIITFAAAKAKLERSSEIATLFHDAGIVSAQAIGIQSTSEEVLKSIRRKNIKLPVLMETSVELERRGVSTYAELIWPLPGETFESFKGCLTSLCNAAVTSVQIYPALLLHATPMEQQIEEFQLETTDANDDASELQLIVSTRDVTRQQGLDGIWLSFAVYCLYNARTLRLLGTYLNDRGILPWAELFWAFARFFRAGNTAVAEHWKAVVEQRTYAEQQAVGRLIHLVLHEQRGAYLRELAAFVRMQELWRHEEARMLFEVDLVNCPYVYANTPFEPAPRELLPLTYVEVTELSERRARVRVHPELLELVRHYVPETSEGTEHELAYQCEQFPFMKAKPMRENYTYVYGMIHRTSVICPAWRAVERDRRW